MVKSLSSLIVFCFCLQLANAQDAHFSQPLMSPLSFNPAMTGYMQETARLSIQSRGQWWSVANTEYYKTISASFDRRYCGQDGFFAFGIQALGNEAWYNPLSNYQLQLSGAYHFNLGNTVLALGGQGGLLHYRLNDSRLRFEDQFDPGTSSFSGNLSQESFSRTNRSTLDGNIGVLFYSTQNRHNFVLGFSVHHLNQPRIQFLEEVVYSVEPLPFKWTVYGSVKSLLHENSGFFLSPSFLIQRQGQQWYGLIGLMPSIGFKAGEFIRGHKVYPHNLSLGGFIRLAANEDATSTFDAVVVQTAYTLRNVKISFAFDFNVSSLKAASGVAGAMELGLVYQFGSTGNCIYCPNF